MSDRKSFDVYIASKTVHAPRWQKLRAEGHPILSTWIDESYPNQTPDWFDLWSRIRSEICSSCALIAYYEDGEILKGAFMEMGMALMANVPIFWVGDPKAFNLLKQDGIMFANTVEDALFRAGVLALATGDR